MLIIIGIIVFVIYYVRNDCMTYTKLLQYATHFLNYNLWLTCSLRLKLNVLSQLCISVANKFNMCIEQE